MQAESSADAIWNRAGCARCRSNRVEFQFSFAFQPIVDVVTGQIYAYEALVRGPGSQPAASVLDQLDEENRYHFDQQCRVRAIEIATKLGMPEDIKLSINFDPNALYDPVLCIRTTMIAAEKYKFDVERLLFELTEHRKVEDTERLNRILDHYANFGFPTAIDDFGAGFAGLGLLAKFRPHLTKIDRELVMHSDRDEARQAILCGTVATCAALRMETVAEGVERMEEFEFLRGLGIRLFQGYLIAKPAFEALPQPDLSRFLTAPTA